MVNNNEPRENLKRFGLVACGTMRPELTSLINDGFIDGDNTFFTAPGLHEFPDMLKKQLARQLEKALEVSDKVIVVYGEKCYFDVATATTVDGLLKDYDPNVKRVDANNCVDMLADEKQRNQIAQGEKIYWLTPGWIRGWDFIFKDWDAAKANETFPAHDKAVVLDAVNAFDELAGGDPEKILRIGDWMKLPLEPRQISLERFKDLLLQCSRALTKS